MNKRPEPVDVTKYEPKPGEGKADGDTMFVYPHERNAVLELDAILADLIATRKELEELDNLLTIANDHIHDYVGQYDELEKEKAANGKLRAELDQKRAGLRKIMEAYYRHCHSVEILDAVGFRREVDEALNESGTERWC